MSKKRKIELETWPFYSIFPEGEYKIDDRKMRIVNNKLALPPQQSIFSIVMSSDEYPISSIHKSYFSNEIKNKIQSINTYCFKFPIKLFEPIIFGSGISTNIRIDKSYALFPNEYQNLIQSMFQLHSTLENGRENEKDFQKILRSLRKYSISYQHRSDPIESFENMWIAFETFFDKISLRTVAPEGLIKLRNTVKQEIKNQKDTIENELENSLFSLSFDQASNKLFEGIDNSYLPIKKVIISQFTSIINKVSSEYPELQLNTEKIINSNLANLNTWYGLRNNLFHNGEYPREDNWDILIKSTSEIENAVRIIIASLLLIHGLIFSVSEKSLTKEEFKEFTNLVRCDEKNEFKSVLHSTIVIEDFILYFLEKRENCTKEDIINAFYIISNESPHLNNIDIHLEFLEEQNKIKRINNIYQLI
ncbi:MAG: hypothetical protein INQ03_02285 [Candidatus Heimdallarchaeota archaeon]|nr:hypothetical protein [Candidatus Heimdallarchaeota archaeon]